MPRVPVDLKNSSHQPPAMQYRLNHLIKRHVGCRLRQANAHLGTLCFETGVPIGHRFFKRSSFTCSNGNATRLMGFHAGKIHIAPHGASRVRVVEYLLGIDFMPKPLEAFEAFIKPFRKQKVRDDDDHATSAIAHQKFTGEFRKATVGSHTGRVL